MDVLALAPALGSIKRTGDMIGNRKVLLGATAALVIAGVIGTLAIAYDEENETAIELSQVPQAARDAAQGQLAGGIREAKVIDREGKKLYELEGRDASGQKISLRVQADGQVLERENDDD
jgi:hypothetical protein